MLFYLVRILIPALIVDIPLTGLLIRYASSYKLLRLGAAFFSVPFYFISALGWIRYYGQTAAFQGQGAIGFIPFFVFGIICSFIRLGVAIWISDWLNERKKQSKLQ